jgi:hypothetical protein
MWWTNFIKVHELEEVFLRIVEGEPWQPEMNA